MNAPILSTAYGQVAGEPLDGFIRFRNVPFADRVDGEHRWRPPRPPQPWSGVRPSDSWAPPVPQPPDRAAVADPAFYEFLFGDQYPTPYSEAGLFLNAWTPSLDPDARRPVMVWLHGGGFTTGAPSRPRDDGSVLAARGDVVVVAPNHRLGALGYLHVGSIVPGTVNNVGMLDIVLALQWVRDHARLLGGDPDNMTVFGESGGAMKVHALFAMPAARGLFHRAIGQAGFFVEGSPFEAMTPDEGAAQALDFLDHVGLGADPVGLLQLSTDEIVAAQDTFNGGGMSWRPVVDVDTVPVRPHAVDVPVPMILGSSAHEGDFLGRYGGSLGPSSLAELEDYLGDRGADLVAGYRANHPDVDDAELIRIIVGDWVFRIPGVQLAERIAAQGQRCYAYLFDWTRAEPPHVRATHSSEGVFAFGTLDTIGVTRGVAAAQPVSDAMLGAWVAFARTGNPNHSGLPLWPPYDCETRATMVITQEIHVESDPGGPDRWLWAPAR